MRRSPKELPAHRVRRVPASPSGRRRRRPTDGNNAALVYRTLRDRIISGALPPGARLVELAVAAELLVSRTPVREALKRLASEQLVYPDASGGMTVHRPDNEEIEEIFEVREVLDALAARLAAPRIDTGDVERMRAANESMAEAIRSDRRSDALVANDLFHDVVYQAAGNAVLARVGRELRDYIRRFNTLPVASHDRVANVLADHAAILEALERRDADAAEEATARHLRAARDYFIRVHLFHPGGHLGRGPG